MHQCVHAGPRRRGSRRLAAQANMIYGVRRHCGAPTTPPQRHVGTGLRRPAAGATRLPRCRAACWQQRPSGPGNQSRHTAYVTGGWQWAICCARAAGRHGMPVLAPTLYCMICTVDGSRSAVASGAGGAAMAEAGVAAETLGGAVVGAASAREAATPAAAPTHKTAAHARASRPIAAAPLAWLLLPATEPSAAATAASSCACACSPAPPARAGAVCWLMMGPQLLGLFRLLWDAGPASQCCGQRVGGCAGHPALARPPGRAGARSPTRSTIVAIRAVSCDVNAA